LLGGIAGADGDFGEVEVRSEAFRVAGDADQGRAEVAFDVHRQGLERGDVEDAAALFLVRDRREHQVVDGGQEGGEGLAGAGGRKDEAGLPALNGGPGQLLGSGGLLEGGGEPGARGLVEAGEGGVGGALRDGWGEGLLDEGHLRCVLMRSLCEAIY